MRYYKENIFPSDPPFLSVTIFIRSPFFPHRGNGQVEYRIAMPYLPQDMHRCTGDRDSTRILNLNVSIRKSDRLFRICDIQCMHRSGIFLSVRELLRQKKESCWTDNSAERAIDKEGNDEDHDKDKGRSGKGK